MKKKIILIIGIIAVIILVTLAILAIAILPEQTNYSIVTYDLNTYIYNPVSIVDNKIDAGDKYILPFIFETTGDRLGKSYIEAEFSKANLTIESISNNKIGTGTIIKTSEDTKPYQILIYGDVDGDGRIGLADSQAIIDFYLDPDDTTKQLTGIYYTAANVSNYDNRVNLMDAQRIIDFYIEDVTDVLSKLPEKDVVTGIEVTNPTKAIYNFGEELELTGVKVRRVTASGIKCIEEDLPANSVTGYNKNQAGIQKLQVQYAGFTSEISVRVLEPVTTLIVDENIKSEDTSVGKKVILGTVKQAEGQSEFNKNDLKTQITLQGSTTSFVSASYKLRSEVYKDFTDENKNDVILVITGAKPGNYEVISYIGDTFDTATAKSNKVNVEIKNTTTISKIEIENSLNLYFDGNNAPSNTEKYVIEEKTVQVETQKVCYTLLPVKFKDQNGQNIKFKIEDFAGYDKATSGKITVSDNYGFSIPGLEVKLFRKDSNGDIVEAGGDNTFDYIGFTPVYNVEKNRINNGTLTITYGVDNLKDSVQENIQVIVVD